MNEKISRLMDGELDDAEFDVVYGGLRQKAALETWACYHAIGDVLRSGGTDAGDLSAGFAQRLSARLASEPTVLAPQQRRRADRAGTWAWAAAATVAAVTIVGWTAMSVVVQPPAGIDKVADANQVRSVRARTQIPSEFLDAHQEYSPSAATQMGGGYLRATSSVPAESR